MSIHLSSLDWIIISFFLSITLIIGIYASIKNKKTAKDFFISGRNMPWWLLGFSMVATTFSADTPNLVTNFVREHGIFGNWQWWAMLPSGMLTVFLYAKLWRRSATITDLEFYELRYSGKLATFLRGFRAIYLGVVFNILIMASVSLAAIKIGGAMLALTPIQSVLGAMIITTIFSTLGGLRGVLLSDFILFIAAMIGSIAAAYFALNLPEVGGMSGLIETLSQNPINARKANVFGYLNTTDLISLLIIPFAIVWWSVWYPGSEPGGGGFLVQRMLAAKDEKNAILATFFFNICHYALRPWPWIIVALCSIVIYPDLQSIKDAVGNVLPQEQIQSDVAYSLMLTKLPSGWIGLVVASLLAAYMSTLSTHLNWGSSYLVNDFYCVFINPNATEKKKVFMGRVFTVLLMMLAGFLALHLKSAISSFNIILSIGAGTGLLFMLRWFWWRINALSELVAMISSFAFAIYFNLSSNDYSNSQAMVYSVALTSLCWILAALFGKQTDKSTLYSFYKKIKPSGSGWNFVINQAKKDNIKLPKPQNNHFTASIIAALFACIMIYSLLIATGELVYKSYLAGTSYMALSLTSAVIVFFCSKKIK